MRHRPVPLQALLLGALTALLAACGSDSDNEERLGAERADQVRDAAVAAGLPTEVADVLALAANGTTATFRITYPGAEAASLVVSQEPPNRRIDVVNAGVVVQSHVVRDGVSYTCSLESEATLDSTLDCERGPSTVDAPGAFTANALDDFADSLAGATDRFDLIVEERTIAETPATCLTTAPKAGTPLDGTGPGVDSICLSPEGAQLLTDSGGERVVADSYTSEVPAGTFEV